MSATKGSSRKSLASIKAEDGAGEDYTPQLSTPKGPAKKYDDDKIVRVRPCFVPVLCGLTRQRRSSSLRYTATRPPRSASNLA